MYQKKKKMKNKILKQAVIAKILGTNIITKLPIKKNALICEFGLNQKITKFNMRELRIKLRSKKARSDEIRVREGGNQKYRYLGKILKYYHGHNSLNNGVLFRNNLDAASFEMYLPLFSPLITHASFMSKNKKSNLYVLRKSSPVRSKVQFDYVIDEN
jgi:ribosomal protein L19